MPRAAGFDASKVKWIVAGSDALPGLLASKRVPCVGQFTVGEPLLRMQAAPAKLVRFAFADAGVNFYGNGIIATDATIASKSDIVRRFVAATIRGMKDAFADPEGAGRIMNKYHPTIEVAVAKGETEAVAELAQVKGVELGMIEPARIEETINAVTGVFQLKTPVGVNDVYAPGFVM
jgi:NitT/TauT family transport system substrate-binding protein